MGAPQSGRQAGGLPPRDQQPSPRIATAARMLRNGHHPAQVAAVTDVPFALVELIAEHLPPVPALPGHPDPPTADPRAAGHGSDNGPDPTGSRDAAVVRTAAQQARQRRPTRILWGAVICTVLNAALGTVGVLTHMDTLAAVCLSLTPLTYVAVLLLLILLPRPVTPVQPRRR
jgi:hypothetical protein